MSSFDKDFLDYLNKRESICIPSRFVNHQPCWMQHTPELLPDGQQKVVGSLRDSTKEVVLDNKRVVILEREKLTNKGWVPDFCLQFSRDVGIATHEDSGKLIRLWTFLVLQGGREPFVFDNITEICRVLGVHPNNHSDVEQFLLRVSSTKPLMHLEDFFRKPVHLGLLTALPLKDSQKWKIGCELIQYGVITKRLAGSKISQCVIEAKVKGTIGVTLYSYILNTPGSPTVIRKIRDLAHRIGVTTESKTTGRKYGDIEIGKRLLEHIKKVCWEKDVLWDYELDGPNIIIYRKGRNYKEPVERKTLLRKTPGIVKKEAEVPALPEAKGNYLEKVARICGK